VASFSQGRTAAAQCGLFTYKSVPVIFEPPCSMMLNTIKIKARDKSGLKQEQRVVTYFKVLIPRL